MEEHFYLIWPVLLVALSRVPLRKVAVGVAIFAAICPVMYLFLYLYQRGFFVHRLTVPAAGAIAMGVVFRHIAILALNQPDRSDRVGHAAVPSVGCRLRDDSFSGVGPLVTGSWKLDQFARYSQILGVALLIDDVARHQGSLAVRFLELAPLRYLGMVSYGIYMWQGLFLGDSWVREDAYIWPPDPLIGLAALVVVVPISYHFFEKPLLAMKEKFRGGQKTTVLAQPSRLS